MIGKKITRIVESPDYSGAYLVAFDLGQYQAILPIPELSESCSPEIYSSNVDLDQFEWSDPEDPDREIFLSLIVDLYWDLYSRGEYMGCMRLAVGIASNRAGEFNFLDESSFKKWILTRDREFYGTWNEEIKEEAARNQSGITDDDLFTYPLNPSQIFTTTFNDTTWYGEKIGCPNGGTPISFRFRTPLSEKYTFNIEFRWSAATNETYEILKAEIDDLQLEYLQKVRLIPNT